MDHIEGGTIEREMGAINTGKQKAPPAQGAVNIVDAGKRLGTKGRIFANHGVVNCETRSPEQAKRYGAKSYRAPERLLQTRFATWRAVTGLAAA